MGGADQTSESSFLKQLFSRYYKDAKLELPPRFGRREWGFMFIGERFMKRHISFSSAREVKSFLIGKGKKMGDRFMIPSHAYHSVAYYTHPNAKMDKKGWLGADLVFDLDADHIPGAEKISVSRKRRSSSHSQVEGAIMPMSGQPMYHHYRVMIEGRSWTTSKVKD